MKYIVASHLLTLRTGEVVELVPDEAASRLPQATWSLLWKAWRIKRHMDQPGKRMKLVRAPDGWRLFRSGEQVYLRRIN